MISMKNKKAAMEMSVGTIVTIVLLMTVLILGLVMIRTIFKGSIENINSVDQSVKNEINKIGISNFSIRKCLTVAKSTSSTHNYVLLIFFVRIHWHRG